MARVMDDVDTARIRWRCRRGLKELDVLMERFAEDCLPRLSPPLIPVLERLLDEADSDLLEWIIGRTTPHAREYIPLIELLRSVNLL